jgi:hypothetical protein
MTEEYKPQELAYLRSNLGEDQDTLPAEICIVDVEGRLHIQKVSPTALINMSRDALRILVEQKFFNKGTSK